MTHFTEQDKQKALEWADKMICPSILEPYAKVLAAALREAEKELLDYREIYPRDTQYWKTLYEQEVDKNRAAYDMLGVHVHNALKERAEKAEASVKVLEERLIVEDEDAATKAEAELVKVKAELAKVKGELENLDTSYDSLREALTPLVWTENEFQGLSCAECGNSMGEVHDEPCRVGKALARL